MSVDADYSSILCGVDSPFVVCSTTYSTLVRNAISRVVSEIANRELVAGTWPELLPFLFSAADSPNATHRQISIFVFFTVLETFVDGGEKLEAYLPQILGVFAKSLQDPESIEVRITTVR